MKGSKSPRLSLFLFFVQAAILGTVTSLPDIPSADYSSLFRSRLFDREREYAFKYRRHQPVSQTLSSTTFPHSSLKQEYENGGELDIGERQKKNSDLQGLQNSAEIQDVLQMIEQSLKVVEKNREIMRKSSRKVDVSGKRVPDSHFVRIGRGQAASRQSTHNTDNPLSDYFDLRKLISQPRHFWDAVSNYQNNFDVNIDGVSDNFSTLKGHRSNLGTGTDEIISGDHVSSPDINMDDASFDDVNTGVINTLDLNADVAMDEAKSEDADIADIDGQIHRDDFQRTPRGYSFLRYGRSTSVNTNSARKKTLEGIKFLQTLLTPSESIPYSFHDITRSNDRPLNFKQFGLYSNSPANTFDRVRRDRALGGFLKINPSVVRRAYIRIGKLPLSVFVRNDPQEDEESMRSPGFRQSASGIVRAGK